MNFILYLFRRLTQIGIHLLHLKYCNNTIYAFECILLQWCLIESHIEEQFLLVTEKHYHENCQRSSHFHPLWPHKLLVDTGSLEKNSK